MIDRRQLIVKSGQLAAGTAVGLGAAGCVASAQPVPAQATAAAVVPPQGAWQRFGEVRRAGGILHYAEIGPENSDQPPVILLHKLGGWLSDWRHVAAELGKTRRVIAFDLPGHGGSHWDGAPPYIQTLAETASLMLGAFDELGFDKVDLIGTSLGGCASVLFGAFYPERLNSLAIVSSALGGRRTLEEIKVAIDEGQTDLFGADGMPLRVEPEQLETTFGIINSVQINEEGNDSRQAANVWIQPSERGVGITDVVGTLNRIPTPTLLLYGARDRAYLRFREEAEARLSDSTTEYVPESGAFVMQDNPAATASILQNWLERNA